MDLKEYVETFKGSDTKITVFHNTTDAMVYALKFAQYGKEEYKSLIGQLLTDGRLFHKRELIVIDKLRLLG